MRAVPFESGYEASYEAGATYISDSSTRFGNATGLDEDGGEALLGGSGRYAGDTYQLQWTIEDLALDTREFRLEGGRQGSYGFHFGLDELPYRQFGTTETVFSVNGNDQLTLPAQLGRCGHDRQHDRACRRAQAGDDRRRSQSVSAGAHFIPLSNLRIYADYRRDDREGVQITSGAGFTQSAMLPRIVDYQTDIIDVGATYANGPLVLSLAWYGSFFENNADSLTWKTRFSMTRRHRDSSRNAWRSSPTTIFSS